MTNRPLRIAVAGTRGHWGQTLREMLARRATPDKPQGELVAVADAGDSAEPLMKWASEQGVSVRRFADHKEMLAVAKPDLFVPCAAFERHAEMCLDALRAGVHVLAEKPVALTDAELSELRALTAANPKLLLAGMMFSRYDPPFLAASEMIARGEVGDVRLINVRKSYKLGQRGPHYHDRATYGGTIPWVGSHCVDWMMAFLGNRAPARVYATHSTAGNRGFGSMEVASSALFEYPDGLTATASIDVLRPDKSPTHGDDWARIVGTRAVLEVRNQTLQITDDAGGVRTVDVPDTGRTLVSDLLDAIALGTRPWIGTAETLSLTQVLLDTRRSADEGRRVDIGSDR